jgi:sugar porter (SP) family MFS transporter
MTLTRWNITALSIFVSLGGMSFGLDTGLIGPVTTMPQFLETFPEAKQKAIQGTLIATILMSAAVSSLFAGVVADWLSRKYTIALGALICGIGCFLEAGSIKFPMLIAGRLLAGVGEGWFLSTISVYLIEISPPSVRGRTASMVQLLITIGIAVGYFVCYGTVSIPSSISWRLPFILQGVICTILAVGAPLMPYSPRWLLKEGRSDEAWDVIEMFDKGGADKQRSKMEEPTNREGSSDTIGSANQLKSILEAFGHGYRGRTIIGIVLMGLQQLSGIDGVLYYAPVLFSQAGLSSRSASFLASGVSGILNILCTIPAQFWLIDKWGRRPSAITGGLIMGVCMTAIWFLYAFGDSKTSGVRWSIIMLIYAFIATFSMTWAISLKILTTEMQPSKTRASASSLSQTSNWLVNLVVALTTPVFLSKSASGPYFMFGAFLYFGAALCSLYAPETLGESLDDIDTVWNDRVEASKVILNIIKK